MVRLPRAGLFIKHKLHKASDDHMHDENHHHDSEEEKDMMHKGIDNIKGRVLKWTKYRDQMNDKEKSRRFYLFISAFTITYIIGLNRARQSENEALRMAAAGSITVLIGESSFYFIDAVNTRTKILSKNEPFHKMLTSIIKAEGIRGGLYKGYTASYYSSLQYGFIYFYLYKSLKVSMKNHFDPKTPSAKAAIYATASTVAEVIALTVYYPYELIKVRLLTKNDKYRYSSVSDAFFKITNKDSIKGLYKGVFTFFFTFMGQYTL